MKYRNYLPIFILLFVLCYSEVTGQSANILQETDYSKGEIIIQLTDSPQANNRKQRNISETGIESIDSVCQKYGPFEVENFNTIRPTNSTSKNNRPKTENIALLKFQGKVNIELIIQELMATGMLVYAEPNYTGSGSSFKEAATGLVPNDYINRLYWADNDGSFPGFLSGQPAPIVDADVDAVEAWDITTGSSSIVLAVCDSGIDPTNQEFAGRIVNGYDFVNSDNNPTDDHGHGTNVTGLATMTGNNSFGLAGMDWNCKIMPVKVIDANNYATWFNLAQGITYAVDNGANVINISIGGTSGNQTLLNAVQYAANNGVLMTVSMMNTDANQVFYPAFYSQTIAVGATDINDHRVRAAYTNNYWGSTYGSHIDLVAPGNTMVSTRYNNNQAFNWWMGGTSQAAPLVAGAATLLLSVDPTLTPAEIRTILRSTADDQVGNLSEDTPGFDIYHGAGRLNVYQALLSISKTDLDISLALEGAYNTTTGDMNTTLYDLGLLPINQPYDVAPWNHQESAGAGLTLADIPSNSVDWVLVSLRNMVNPSTEILKTAGILLSDGSIFFPNNQIVPDGSYRIVVEHRNHMGAMSAVKVVLTNNTLSYDFTAQNSYTNGISTGQKNIGGTRVLVAGDADQSDVGSFDINGVDKIPWNIENGNFNLYAIPDLDLNGDVNGNDIILWDQNSGLFSAVPK